MDAELNLKRAEAAAQSALRINPQSLEGMIALSGAYSEEGREQEAIRILKQAVVLAPNHETAWQMLGYSYYYAGLNELAEPCYRRIIELNPAPLQPHWMRARMLLYSGRVVEADKEMRQVVGANPDQFKALAYFSGVLYYEGKLDEAQVMLDRSIVLSRDVDDDTARMMVGFLYASRHQLGKIVPRLLKYRPENLIDGDAAYWMAGIYALPGERQHAIEWLKRTVALGNVNYPWFERDKNFDSLRSDPEHQSVMAGVRKRWEAYNNEFDSAP